MNLSFHFVCNRLQRFFTKSSATLNEANQIYLGGGKIRLFHGAPGPEALQAAPSATNIIMH
jgi:hypothetical protein